jgi:hypothetical protein
MRCSQHELRWSAPCCTTKLGWMTCFVMAIALNTCAVAESQNKAPETSNDFYVDCRSSTVGDGSTEHPWNSLTAAQAHPFAPGERISLARGSVCHGSFAPQGSGLPERPIRLTSYGTGPRPRILATSNDRQAISLFNQEYWQIDSLDIAGSNVYGIFISGDKGTLHHIYLRNLLVHDVMGAEPKNKDNGLVVIGPSGPDVVFDDVLVDGVSVAHTNQWAGILIGGGNYAWKPDAKLNSRITVRNSTVQDVYGDGIVLFRDANGLVETSVAWQTGMQPTESIGTPNAIWTWTCTDCVVRDNEAFLTDSPGIDGGAYDIDWDNTRNTVERNYAHDTQGYCFAAFAAGYVTRESVIRDNLCIDNGLSPRLALLQGAAYLHTWNDGTLRGLRIEHNTFLWNPPVASAAAIVDDAATGGDPVIFNGNRIDSSASLFYRGNTQFRPVANIYHYLGPEEAEFIAANGQRLNLATLQAAGLEAGTTLDRVASPTTPLTSLRIDATIEFKLDSDGLLMPASRAQWVVLKSLAAQYTTRLTVTVHWIRDGLSPAEKSTVNNALLDLEKGSILFDMQNRGSNDGRHGSATLQEGSISVLSANGQLLEQWHGFQNAATIGGAVRAKLGAPRYAEIPQTSSNLKILLEEAK